MANYHPSHELLMQFAAGQMTNALGIMVACHLENCHECATTARLYDRIGGELLKVTTSADISTDLLTRTMQRLDDPAPTPPPNPGCKDARLPRPIHRFVPPKIEDIPWRGFTRSIKEFELPISDERFTAKFYKILAGQELPEHTHKGNEFTLVMDGSFSDLAGSYHQGDFILADTQVTHQPKAHESGDCICFAVMDAPLKMTGFFGRMLNPFIR